MSEKPPAPQVGDKRIHIRTKLPLYVWATIEHEGTDYVVFSATQPDPKRKARRCGGIMQTVTVAEWLEKTEAPR